MFISEHSKTFENVPFPNCLFNLYLFKIIKPWVKTKYPFESFSYLIVSVVVDNDDDAVLDKDDDDDDVNDDSSSSDINDIISLFGCVGCISYLKLFIYLLIDLLFIKIMHATHTDDDWLIVSLKYLIFHQFDIYDLLSILMCYDQVFDVLILLTIKMYPLYLSSLNDIYFIYSVMLVLVLDGVYYKLHSLDITNKVFFFGLLWFEW